MAKERLAKDEEKNKINNEEKKDAHKYSFIEQLGETATDIATSEPPFCRVLIHNDDHTPMDFVVDIIKKHFHKNNDEAVDIMLRVHHNGTGICGVYSQDIAETKALMVMEDARKHSYPLQCSIEEV
ncbi:MAG: ATP-dependent Clp protease adaptor ClpS [SAR324 cluster bacterium]|nr:ATP-dependent Clp protease adaptor ClpS [SAR324 cluster bacterium]